MKVDITSLLIVFDELLPSFTNEEQGVYWFKTFCTENLTITLFFSIYERYVGVSVYNNSDVTIASINMKNCSEIRVLDEKKKNLEIIHEGSAARCFLDLRGSSIINYDE